VQVSGAQPDDTSNASTLRIDPAEPVLLRAVDGALLPSVQVSNHLRPLAYSLPAGTHILWLSELPYGFPFVPQYIDCFVMQVTLIPGSRYNLRLDPRLKLPVLSRGGTAEAEAVGKVVDRPLLIERGCQWR